MISSHLDSWSNKTLRIPSCDKVLRWVLLHLEVVELLLSPSSVLLFLENS